MVIIRSEEYTSVNQNSCSDIETTVSIELLTAFADALEQHIRFEERTWFPHLEEILDTRHLEKIGKALDFIHETEADTYHDEFWK